MLVHAGAGGATLSFQIDALDDLERPGREAGVEVEIVGETYGRTALISAPDGPRRRESPQPSGGFRADAGAGVLDARVSRRSGGAGCRRASS